MKSAGSLKELWDRIDALPQEPRKIREPFGTVLFSLPDLPAFLSQNGCRFLPFLPRCAPFYYRYPRPFRRRIFKGSGGVRIDTVIALKPGSDTLIVLVHGIFQSKNFKFIRDMAARLSRDYSVAVVDTRDHLGTFCLSPSYPSSGGTIEAKDILEIAKKLKSDNEQLRIYLIGFSYGGGIVLNGLDSSRAGELLSGVLAISPTMIMDHAVKHIDTDPGVASPFYPMYSLFQTCLRLRHGLAIRTFREYIERAAEQYGCKAQEILMRSSVISFIDRIGVPTLMVIAKNDPVIPKEDVLQVSAMARNNEYVHIIERACGGHIAFAFIDQQWFYRVVQEFVNDTWTML